MTAFTLDFSSVTTLDAEQFFALCRANPDVKFERSAKGQEAEVLENPVSLLGEDVLPGFVLSPRDVW